MLNLIPGPKFYSRHYSARKFMMIYFVRKLLLNFVLGIFGFSNLGLKTKSLTLKLMVFHLFQSCNLSEWQYIKSEHPHLLYALPHATPQWDLVSWKSASLCLHFGFWVLSPSPFLPSVFIFCCIYEWIYITPCLNNMLLELTLLFMNQISSRQFNWCFIGYKEGAPFKIWILLKELWIFLWLS